MGCFLLLSPTLLSYRIKFLLCVSKMGPAPRMSGFDDVCHRSIELRIAGAIRNLNQERRKRMFYSLFSSQMYRRRLNACSLCSSFAQNTFHIRRQISVLFKRITEMRMIFCTISYIPKATAVSLNVLLVSLKACTVELRSTSKLESLRTCLASNNLAVGIQDLLKSPMWTFQQTPWKTYGSLLFGIILKQLYGSSHVLLVYRLQRYHLGNYGPSCVCFSSPKPQVSAPCVRDEFFPIFFVEGSKLDFEQCITHLFQSR
jgi:hypothetical protein